MKLTISKNEQLFKLDNSSFFYLADTVWSAFTNASFEDWAHYLDYRKLQGFNVLQINILRQWDASESDFNIHPFQLHTDGSYNYSNLNEQYFARAEQMLEMAVSRGFIPALVLLWCNYVPDTWAEMFQKDNKMPEECVVPYVEYAVKRFKKFNPIYFISGDTNFPSDRANTYYMKALETVKAISPESLTSLHIQGRLNEIPTEFQQHEALSFYTYQSGHNSEFQAMSHELATHFYNKEPKCPVINGEPCYEQISYSRNVYGRYSAFDARKAAWQSVLAGGGAGVTYGAHGIWSWHKHGKKFGIVEGEGFDTPYDWRDALRFEGAWDYSFIKYIFDSYNLIGIKPANITLNNNPEITAASTANGDKIVIYIPINTKVHLNINVQDYVFTTIDLEKKRFAVTELITKGNQSSILMHPFQHDVVIIGKKR